MQYAKKRRDIYKEVTDNMIQALKNGAPPWIRPWTKDNSYAGRPVNAVTGRKYSGVNVPILWSSALENGYPSDRWLTFRQASTIGGKVCKGQKSTIAVLYRDVEVSNPDASSESEDEQTTKKVFVKGFSLFNVAQCDWLPSEVANGPAVEVPDPTWDKHPGADKLVSASGASILHKGESAFYVPKQDYIGMPARCAFEKPAGYYSTLLHELTHWTGHESRLNRPGIASPKGINSESYAAEELVAEIGSAFLCADFGIPGELRHEGYVLWWIKLLDHNPKAIFQASAEASRAADYLFDQIPAAKKEDMRQAA